MSRFLLKNISYFDLLKAYADVLRRRGGMVKLVDTPDLGSGDESRGSSSLSTPTKLKSI
jgi:hypothetical protein